MRTLAAVAVLHLSLSAQNPAIDPAIASQYFAEARALPGGDGTAVWGVKVCGPMLFAHRSSRLLVANQPDKQGLLKKQGDLWTATAPPDLGFANTGTNFGGTRFTMLLWPLPENDRERSILIAHECFHRAQPELGFEGADAAAVHLDTEQGRVWLLLEWRALEEAVLTSGAARKRALADALAFRRHRQSLFPQALATENTLECNEGLAEYTGMALGTRGPTDFQSAVVTALRQGFRRPTFARSFAYISGPAYGYVLDAASPAWRKQPKAITDLASLAATAYKLPESALSAAELHSRAARYGGEPLMATERRRELQRQATLASNRRQFIEGPVLVLPAAAKFNYSYDPNAVTGIDGAHSIYSATVTDEWGRIEGSLLMVRDPNGAILRVQVPAPETASPAATPSTPLKGEDWELTLNEGWTLAPGPRPGDFTVTRK